MDVNAVDEAFEILSDIIRRAPKHADVLLTTAECLIRQNKSGTALEVLDSVIVDDQLPARWFALVAIASSLSGDVSRALSSLEQGCQHPNLDDHGRVLLSQAALRLNRWSDAIEVLSHDVSNNGDQERIIMEAHIRIRAMETKPIYSEADATYHISGREP